MKTNATLKAVIVDYAKARPVFEQYKAVYKEYRAARFKMQEVLTVKVNIDALLGAPQQEKNKEQER